MEETVGDRVNRVVETVGTFVVLVPLSVVVIAASVVMWPVNRIRGMFEKKGDVEGMVVMNVEEEGGEVIDKREILIDVNGRKDRLQGASVCRGECVKCEMQVCAVSGYGKR